MKTQAEVLEYSGITTDELPGYKFRQDDLDLLAVAEGFAFNEWSKVAEHLGLCATLSTIPINYDTQLHIEGKWTKEYSKPSDYERN